MIIEKKKTIIVAIIASLLLQMSTNAVITTLYKSSKRSRRFAVRPMNRARNKEGFYYTVFKDMEKKEWDREQFFKLTRMTPGLFKFLLSEVGPHLTKLKRSKNPISPEQRLLITIHYLAHGCSMQQIAWTYRIGKTTVHCIIKQVCQVIWEVLRSSQLPDLKHEDWLRIADGYFNRWNLPNCIGSVDGKHVNIKAPKNSGSLFFNYKKSFSLVLMATCDSYYRFTSIDVGAAGGNHDSTVFKDSGFGQKLLTEQLDIPPASFIPNSNIKFPYYIAADAAFPLHKHIMRPYPGKHLGPEKSIYNYRLSRGRRTIENSFGILSQRWRILLRPIEASVEMAEFIVLATIVLHNFLQSNELDLAAGDRKYCPTGFADYVGEDGILYDGHWRSTNQTLKSVRKIGTNNFMKSVGEQRDLLARYFVSAEGAVDWQEDYVYRGGAPGV